MTRLSLSLRLLTVSLALAGGMLGPAAVSAGEIGPESIPARIASAPAVAEFPSGAIAVVRTDDNRIFYSKYSEGTPKSAGWSEVPGGGRTTYAPAVIKTDYHNLIYAAVVGVGGQGLWLQRYYPPTTSFEGGAWSGTWEYFGGGFIAGPELAASGDVLSSFAPGLDGRVYHRTFSVTQGLPLAGGWMAINGFSTTVEVGARWIQPIASIPISQLVLVGRGNDRRLYTTRGEFPLGGGPLTFEPWSEIPGGGLTDHAPALDPFDGTPPYGDFFDGVHVLVRGTADGIWYQTLVNNKWSAGWTYAPKVSTAFAPEISGGFNTAALYVTGKDGGLYFQAMTPTNEAGLLNFRVLVPSGGWTLVLGSIVGSTPPPPPTPTPLPHPTSTPAPLARPDLLWVGPPSYDSQTRKINITFKNAGNGNAGGFRVAVIFDNAALGDIVYNGMAAGQGDTISVDPGVLSPGLHTYNFNLDVYNTVAESNDSNNAYFGYLNI